MFRKKIPLGRIIPSFFFESSESDRVFNYLHDLNFIFRARVNYFRDIFRAHSTTGSIESCIHGNDVNRTALAHGQVDKQAKTNVGVIYNRQGSGAGYKYWTRERGAYRGRDQELDERLHAGRDREQDERLHAGQDQELDTRLQIGRDRKSCLQALTRAPCAVP